MEYNIYLIQNDKLKLSAAKLLEKLYAAGFRGIILLQNEAELQEWDRFIWTFSTLAFVPHSLQSNCVEGAAFVLTDKIANCCNDYKVLVTNSAKNLQELCRANFEKYFFFLDNQHDYEGFEAAIREILQGSSCDNQSEKLSKNVKVKFWKYEKNSWVSDRMVEIMVEKKCV